MSFPKLGVWRDETSYSQGDKERKPACWSLYLTREVKITVMTNHLYHPGKWSMHARPWYDTYPMKLEPEAATEVAQRMALELVNQKVAELREATNVLVPTAH